MHRDEGFSAVVVGGGTCLTGVCSPWEGSRDQLRCRTLPSRAVRGHHRDRVQDEDRSPRCVKVGQSPRWAC